MTHGYPNQHWTINICINIYCQEILIFKKLCLVLLYLILALRIWIFYSMYCSSSVLLLIIIQQDCLCLYLNSALSATAVPQFLHLLMNVIIVLISYDYYKGLWVDTHKDFKSAEHIIKTYNYYLSSIIFLIIFLFINIIDLNENIRKWAVTGIGHAHLIVSL